MNLSAFTEIVQTSWALVPFPLLLLYLFVLGFVWLYLEYQVTRVTRHTPGWRAAPPILPGISMVIVWVLQLSRVLFWFWLIFFLGLLLALLGDQFVFGTSTDWARIMLLAGRAWSGFYSNAVETLDGIWRSTFVFP